MSGSTPGGCAIRTVIASEESLVAGYCGSVRSGRCEPEHEDIMSAQSVNLPPHIACVLRQLIDGGAHSVWLIGSRANDSAREGSDWDLLSFQNHDPIATKVRQTGVDVLCVGPSGNVLPEGKPVEFIFRLSDLEWTEEEDGYACYTGKHFIEYSDKQGVDYDMPRFHRQRLRALRLWSNSSC